MQFNAFDATVTNPLFQADAVSSFTGISKTLFELHYTIFENIQEALQEARREDLRAQVGGVSLGLRGCVVAWRVPWVFGGCVACPLGCVAVAWLCDSVRGCVRGWLCDCVMVAW